MKVRNEILNEFQKIFKVVDNLKAKEDTLKYLERCFNPDTLLMNYQCLAL